MKTVMAVCLAALCSGCMSTGGLVIGPASYGTSKMNEPDVTKRAALQVKAPPQVFRGIAAGMRDNEIAMGLGVDVLALKEAIQSEQLTFGEAMLQAGGCVVDAAIYGFAAKRTGALEYVRNGFGTKSATSIPSSSASGQGSISIVNNTGTVNLNQGNQGE